VKRFLKWLALGCFGLILGLLAPVGYVELACRPSGQTLAYASILPPEDHRAEGRTLLTYPEWHIVHAYDDYARVIQDGDPHDYRFLSSIGGFWTSLCSLSQASGPHGGFPGEFKQTIYTIGVSFTAEMLAKAAYEETFGRVAAWLRGPDRSPLDVVSAQQARAYSQFLQQVPWYRWDFSSDISELDAGTSGSWRDRERRMALGLEYSIKARYATVIAAAVANMEPDALRLRMIVTGLPEADLGGIEGVSVMATRAEGVEIETLRYRALTTLLSQMALAGADFVEIAGNDDIMLTLTSEDEEIAGALHSFPRQGYDDNRHLVMVKVSELAQTLREIDRGHARLEHIHDF